MPRLIGLFLCCTLSLCAAPFERAELTKATGSVIRGKSSVETGPQSRVELTFPDSTIARVGSSSEFRYIPGSRKMVLEAGTLLFASPKGAGGGVIYAGPVVMKVTGSACEVSNIGGAVKVICLDGKVFSALAVQPQKTTRLRPGEIADIPSGAVKMPRVAAVNLKTLVKSSALMNMGAFPGLKAIEKNAAKQVRSPTFKVGALSPEGSDPVLGLTAQAMQTSAITAQETAIQQQQLAAQQLAAQQAAEAAAAQQQIAVARQLAAQQQAAAQQQQQQQQQTSQGGGGGPQGNQGQGPQEGNQGNQGKKPPSPPGQGNKPPAPPGQQKK